MNNKYVKEKNGSKEQLRCNNCNNVYPIIFIKYIVINRDVVVLCSNCVMELFTSLNDVLMTAPLLDGSNHKENIYVEELGVNKVVLRLLKEEQYIAAIKYYRDSGGIHKIDKNNSDTYQYNIWGEIMTKHKITLKEAKAYVDKIRKTYMNNLT